MNDKVKKVLNSYIAGETPFDAMADIFEKEVSPETAEDIRSILLNLLKNIIYTEQRLKNQKMKIEHVIDLCVDMLGNR